MTAASRLRLVSILIVAGCLASMAVSHRAWVSAGTWGRSLPMVPFVRGLPAVSFPWDVMFAALATSLLICTAVWQRRRWLNLAAIGATALLIMGDQVRLQPWMYQYLMMLGVLAFCRRRSPGDERITLGTLRLIIVCIYIFSGLHKFNVSFVSESAPLMLKPIGKFLPGGGPAEWMGWMMAGTEILLGIILAWRPTRVAGVALALGMHSAILLLIGPLGINYNHVVWPWNLNMMAMDVILFWPRGSGPAPVQSILSKARRAQGLFNAPTPAGPAALFVRVVVVFLAAIAPIGGLLGWIDAYLSWGMYTGAPTVAAIKLTDADIAELPPDVAGQVQDLKSTGKTIVILDWAFDNLQIGCPEERWYRAVAAELARDRTSPNGMTLVIIHKPSRWNRSRLIEEVPLSTVRGSAAASQPGGD